MKATSHEMSKHPLGFCGLSNNDSDYASAPTVILPIPFDKTSTWLKGADKGPAAIIEASRYLEFYDIETDSEALKKGIFTAEPIRSASSSALIKKTDVAVSKYLKDNKLVVALGGEHSVSIGVIKSFSKQYEDLSILHLDAHADSRDSYEGSRYNHACVIARPGSLPGTLSPWGYAAWTFPSAPVLTRKGCFLRI